MKIRRSFYLFAVLSCLLLTLFAQERADKNDEQILQLVLTNVLHHPQLNRPRNLSIDNPRLVLRPDVPRGLRIDVNQIRFDTGKELHDEEASHLIARNQDDQRIAKNVFQSLVFSTEIVVTNTMLTEGSFNELGKKVPNSLVWIRVWLPGYSNDRQSALVHGRLGPSSHGGDFTARVRKKKDGWEVVWISLVYRI